MESRFNYYIPSKEAKETYFSAVYDILVQTLGANESDRENFIACHSFSCVEEWRFQGKLGFGGKYWSGRNQVSFYAEDSNPVREFLTTQANEQLSQISIQFLISFEKEKKAAFVKDLIPISYFVIFETLNGESIQREISNITPEDFCKKILEKGSSLKVQLNLNKESYLDKLHIEVKVNLVDKNKTDFFAFLKAGIEHLNKIVEKHKIQIKVNSPFKKEEVK